MKPPPNFNSTRVQRRIFEFEALSLIMVISPSSGLEIMDRFFCWIPYSLKNSLKNFDNFLSTGSTSWELAHPVRRISIKVHYWTKFEFGAPELVLGISPSSELGITPFFLFVFLFFFWHSVQPVLRVSFYGALILEPKSYLVWAHKLHISPRHDLGPVIGHFLGFL